MQFEFSTPKIIETNQLNSHLCTIFTLIMMNSKAKYFGLRNDTIKELSRTNSLKSISIIFWEWCLILSTIFISVILESTLFYIFSYLLIGNRMYAFYSLIHEGCHYHIHHNRKVNDWGVNFFLAWPLFIDVRKMRKVHFQHHKYLQTESDPEMAHLNYEEFQFPMKRIKLIGIILKDLSGYNYVKYKIINWRRILDIFKISFGRMIYFLSWVVVFTFMEVWQYVFLFWFLPYMTIYQLFNRIRLYTEHFNLEKENTNINTRTLSLPFWKSYFLAPYGLGFHSEHHLYPYVPFYHLRKLHEELISDTKYENSFRLDRKYSGLLKSIFLYGAN